MDRLPLRNSWAPRRSSTLRICWEMLGWVVNSRLAAAVNERSSYAATNSRISLRSTLSLTSRAPLSRDSYVTKIATAPSNRAKRLCAGAGSLPVITAFMKRLLLGLCVLSATVAAAEDTMQPSISLSYSSPYSPSHAFSQADQDWIEYVETRSAGRIDIVPYWSGVLTTADESILELRHGVADIAYIAPIYSLGGMYANKAQTAFYNSGHFLSVANQITVLNCLRQRFPVLDEELRGVVPLAMQGGNQIHLLTRDKAIRQLDDLKGLRIRAPIELIPVVDTLGADAVFLPMGDVYTALSKGVIDGVLTAPDTISAMHLGEVTNYFSLLTVVRGAYPARAISERALNRLPADVRELLLDSRSYWEERLAVRIEADGQAGMDYAHELRIEITAAAPEAQARFDELYMASADNIAQGLLARGIDGPALYAATVELTQKVAQGEIDSCR